MNFNRIFTCACLALLSFVVVTLADDAQTPKATSSPAPLPTNAPTPAHFTPPPLKRVEGSISRKARDVTLPTAQETPESRYLKIVRSALGTMWRDAIDKAAAAGRPISNGTVELTYIIDALGRTHEVTVISHEGGDRLVNSAVSAVSTVTLGPPPPVLLDNGLRVTKPQTIRFRMYSDN